MAGSRKRKRPPRLCLKVLFSLTPGFSPVTGAHQKLQQPFQRFHFTVDYSTRRYLRLGQKKPLKTVPPFFRPGVTGLKPGLNERSRRWLRQGFLRMFLNPVNPCLLIHHPRQNLHCLSHFFIRIEEMRRHAQADSGAAINKKSSFGQALNHSGAIFNVDHD